jgi:hypothetical protein
MKLKKELVAEFGEAWAVKIQEHLDNLDNLDNPITDTHPQERRRGMMGDSCYGPLPPKKETKMPSTPKFQVGDEVEFELMAGTTLWVGQVGSVPRWGGHGDFDRGGSGMWHSGIVDRLGDHGRVTVLDYEGRETSWPNPQKNPRLYQQPGYLRHRCVAAMHNEPPIEGEPVSLGVKVVTTTDEPSGLLVPTESTRKKCDCPLDVLMGGCKCGGV